MSYAIYKTESIIVRIAPSGEASRDVVFLTRDLGKITARVQSGRAIESKMRMHLTRYNHVIIDVVRGKSFWRLTGIHQFAPHKVFTDETMLHAFHRAATLAEHLIRGEDPHPELFDFFVNLLNYIDSVGGGYRHSVLVLAPEQNDESEIPIPAAGLELYAVIKVLEHLGYWQGESFPETPNDEMLQKCVEQKTELVAMINEGIRATQII